LAVLKCDGLLLVESTPSFAWILRFCSLSTKRAATLWVCPGVGAERALAGPGEGISAQALFRSPAIPGILTWVPFGVRLELKSSNGWYSMKKILKALGENGFV